MLKRYFIFILFWAPTFVLAQKYSNEFLNIGVGARALAMGGAQVASTRNAAAGYWNPAGLMHLQSDLSLAAMHAEWYGGVGNFDYVGIIKPIHKKSDSKKKILGLTFLRFGVDNIPNTLTLFDEDGTINYNNIVPFSATDYALLLHYAQGIYTDDVGTLSIGGNVKVIHRVVGPFAKAWGFGLDLGLQYKLGDIYIGLMAKDFTNTFNAWKINFSEKEKEILKLTNNTIPIGSLEVTRPQFVLGLGYGKDFENFGFLIESNATLSTDGRRNVLVQGEKTSLAANLGAELKFKETIFLRAGVGNFQQQKQLDGSQRWIMEPSAGIGLKFYQMQIDYAFSNLNNANQANYSHIISLNLDLNFDYIRKAIRNANR